MESASSTPRRNIGAVGRTIRTRSSAGDEVSPETLETLFEGLQRNISMQFREQQRDFNARWEKERSRAEEKQQEERTASSAIQKALEERMAAMESSYQVLSSNFQLFLEKFSATAVRDGDREALLVNPSTSAGLAIPQPSPPVSQQGVSGVSRNVSDLGYVLKPPKFEGKTNWEEFKLQFEAIAGANRWDEPRKALALVASLEGPARSILTSLSVEKQTDFPALISALAFRYGTKNFENLNYVKFQNYKQRKGESISDLATEIERLAQAAFCECPLEIRDKLAASQFVSPLANEEMKRMLRLGGFTSLRAAVIRALEIEAVESMANASDIKKKKNIF
uniref:uncharacterized protein LOC117611356 n=1 Tax=Osmia lignaria TaxID=473952 RepID=UPI00147937D7|nr:uncharacterized protein LOC117611356 [Osmia lignaria]